MLNQFVFVYLDDILIYSRSALEHVFHVRQVIQLFVKAEKCDFHCATILFLGHVIVAGNIQMNPNKVSVVVDWPQPTSRVQLQCFLLISTVVSSGVTLASHLSALTSPKVPSIWSPAVDWAFSDLKQ